MAFSVRASLEQFTLEHPSGEGVLKISVAAPSEQSPSAAVPVLYVVDADILFGLAAEIARLMSSIDSLPPFYVVGIGYDAPYGEFLKKRTADLTPPASDTAAGTRGAVDAAIGSDRNGGADAFLAFLTKQLRQEIRSRYPETEGGQSILFGHSLGGLFAAHSLLAQPNAFSTFLISSPSLWWDDFSIFGKIPAFAVQLAASPSEPRVFVDVGGKEQDIPTSVPDGVNVSLEEARMQIRTARMVDTARDFADALRKTGVTDLRHAMFVDEDHVSVGPAAILHGLRFALGRQS